MADRTIAPVSDVFLIWTAVITSLTIQLILALLGLGVGIIAVSAADPATVAWAGFLWWAASGVFAAGVGGMVIAALGQDIDDGRKVLLALLAWALALLIVAAVIALSAGGGASVFAALGGPFPAMLEAAADGTITDERRYSLSAGAVSSVVALLVGAAASAAGAIFGFETNVRTARRA